MKYILLIGFMLFWGLSYTQERDPNALQFGDTNMTNKRPKYKSKGQEEQERKILTLIKNSPKNTLNGNKCFEDYLYDLGIRYQVQSSSNPQYKPVAKYFHNVGVRVRTTFRNGPLWRIRLAKRRRECQLLLRDFMG